MQKPVANDSNSALSIAVSGGTCWIKLNRINVLAGASGIYLFRCGCIGEVERHEWLKIILVGQVANIWSLTAVQHDLSINRGTKFGIANT